MSTELTTVSDVTILPIEHSDVLLICSMCNDEQPASSFIVEGENHVCACQGCVDEMVSDMIATADNFIIGLPVIVHVYPAEKHN